MTSFGFTQDDQTVERVIDGRFCPRKRGRPSGADPAGEGPAVDGPGRWRRYSAGSIPGRDGPAEGTRVDPTLASLPRKRRPSRLIVDRGDDSHGLRRSLKRRGSQPISLARRTPPTRPIRTAAIASGIGVAGASSGRSAGSAPSAGSPVATIGCWPPAGASFTSPVPSWSCGGL